MASQTYFLHATPINFDIDDVLLGHRLQIYWRAFRGGPASDSPPVYVRLDVVDERPTPPQLPLVSAGPEVSYFLDGDLLVILYHNWARFDVQLSEERIEGSLVRSVVRDLGSLEDMILIALAPLLRRRGYFTLHAFAAAIDDRALMILGDIGAGKTTTGLSLLARNARLIANDAPLLHIDEHDALHVYAYPGLISAYPDSLAYFPELAALVKSSYHRDNRGKIAFSVEDVWPDAWAWQAAPAALAFPQITPGLSRSWLEPMSAFEALQRLLTQSVESWDAATIPAHLRVLRRLADSAPAFHLHLAPDIPRLPDLLLPLLEDE